MGGDRACRASADDDCVIHFGVSRFRCPDKLADLRHLVTTAFTGARGRRFSRLPAGRYLESVKGRPGMEVFPVGNGRQSEAMEFGAVGRPRWSLLPICFSEREHCFGAQPKGASHPLIPRIAPRKLGSVFTAMDNEVTTDTVVPAAPELGKHRQRLLHEGRC